MQIVRTARRVMGAAALGAAVTLPLALGAYGAPEVDGGGGGGNPKPAPTAPHAGAESWGANSVGQLGIGIASQLDRPTPVTVHIPDGVRAVDGGLGHGLALLTNGTVKSWGLNAEGELGQGFTSAADPFGNVPEPGSVAGLSGVKAIAAGYRHSLALLTNGTVVAWGDNDRGQLGDGTTEDRNRPVPVTGLTGVKAVAAGQSFSLALLANGTVKAWGDNNAGELGNGTTSDQPQPTPVDVVGLTGRKVTAIDSGSVHSLALLANGTVVGWGSNEFGQLGTGVQTPFESTPVDATVLAGVKVRAVAAGDGYSLALLRRGTVKGWGVNASGELGDGTFVSPRLQAVDTVGLTGVTAIAAGKNFETPAGQSLAISGNSVFAWGNNLSGEVGDGTQTNRNTPVAVRSGLAKPHSIAAAVNFSLAS
ncbi:RCC1 domain-containing protein [Catellatospora tritici]|uniref:RCC1 domain-containing protein n=1 Tax=Catellatospora tritici TaxID=2851566 RepID=UPI001C2D2C07|nr:cell wall anchor protein [Catellatospora tritici]MBV1855758.1 cell wall anchor protein [Catellatospora tritici]